MNVLIFGHLKGTAPHGLRPLCHNPSFVKTLEEMSIQDSGLPKTIDGLVYGNELTTAQITAQVVDIFGPLSITDANDNVRIGLEAGISFTTGSRNVLLGHKAGRALTTGSDNVLQGYLAGTLLTSGVNNVFYGNNVGSSATTANNNLLFGYQAGTGLTTGDDNAVFGTQAGLALGAASRNTLFGEQAGAALSTAGAVDNVFMGTRAGLSADDIEGSVVIGHEAGQNLSTGGDDNVLVGHRCGRALTSGHDNVFMGTRVAEVATTAFTNVGMGHEALRALTEGFGNIGIGFEAGSGITTGDYNIALGRQSLQRVTTGEGNIAGGRYAGHNASAATSLIVALGYEAYGDGTNTAYTTGTNTYVGARAGLKHATGTSNLFIGGSNTSSSDRTISQCVYVGASTDPGDSARTTCVGCDAGPYGVIPADDAVGLGYQARPGNRTVVVGKALGPGLSDTIYFGRDALESGAGDIAFSADPRTVLAWNKPSTVGCDGYLVMRVNNVLRYLPYYTSV